MSELAIRALGVSRRFGDFLAVDGLDLCVPKGQIHGFLGPNGCGKSTTLRMLTACSPPRQERWRCWGCTSRARPRPCAGGSVT